MAAVVVAVLLLLPRATATACALDPILPERLTRNAQEQPLCAGFLNVSAPPFSAVGDGWTDDTAALQAALEDAYTFRMAVLLDPGRTFLLSRQLRAVQLGQPASMREFGYQIVGGRGSVPPILKVQDNADMAGFPSVYTSKLDQKYEARPAVLFALNMSGQANQANSQYSQMLRNVDIDLGHNPQLSGVSMDGAQLCSIEDVRVRGRSFMAGVVGLPGSGGYSANVNVTGGNVAVWQYKFRPNPSISGLIALNQSLTGVLLEDARGPLVLSGFVIRSSLSEAGIIVTKTGGGDGGAALEDGMIALDRQAATGILSNGADISLRNLYVNAANAVKVQSSMKVQGVVIQSSPGTAKRIEAWSVSSGGSIAFGAGGINVSAAAGSSLGYPTLNLPAASAADPPTDGVLVSMHSWSPAWARSLQWSSDPATMLDAVRDCGATPDFVNATDDDGAAIAACLARSPRNGIVFVPRGTFLLWDTLVLRSGRKLVGAGKHCATLVMRQSQAFASQPLLQIESLDDGNVDVRQGSQQQQVHDDMVLSGGSVLSDLALVAVQRGTVLSINAPGVVTRDLRTVPCKRFKSPDQPTCPTGDLPPTGSSTPVAVVTFSGSASGRFYGLSLDHCDTYLVEGDALLAVNGVRPSADRGDLVGIHLYQLSAEHLPTDYQVKVLPGSSHVHIHAFKYESAGFLAHPGWGPPGGGLFSCASSSNISIFGGSGNYGIMNATMSADIVSIRGCEGIRISSLTRTVQRGEAPAPEAKWISAVSTGNSGGAPLQIDDSEPYILLFSGIEPDKKCEVLANSLCSSARRASMRTCLVCCGTHQSQLKAVGCTDAYLHNYCQ